jgi:branched-chain amino acid transport system substrate-binding protein
LLLALYRCDRQAEALDAYAQVRQTFARELGLEPGPALRRLQEQILAHDPALSAPARASGPRIRRRVRPRTAWMLAGAGVAAVAGIGVVVALAGGGDAPRPVAGGAIVHLNPATGKVEERIAVGGVPGPLSVGAGATWALDLDAQTVTRVRAGEAPATFATGAPLIDVAAGRLVYIGTGVRAPRAQLAGPVVGGVQRVDPTTRTFRGTVALPGGATTQPPPDHQLALVGNDVWSIAADGSIVRIAGGERVAARVGGIAAVALASGGAGLWAIEDDGGVARIDTRRARVGARTHLVASSVAGLAVSDQDVWVSAPGDGVLWRVPAARPSAARAVRLARGVGDVAVGGGAVWVANPVRGTVTRVDERSGRVTRTVAIGGQPRRVAVARGAVWVSVAAGGRAATDDRQLSSRLTPAACEPAFVGRGTRPDTLLVSDLPLQGGIHVSTEHMTAAISLAVRMAGFRAGSRTVGYVSCDDSVGRTGIFDEARCTSNARAYVREASVLAVVGALNSPCTRAELAELQRAGARAPAMVSPLSTEPSLTRGARARGTVRAFARVIATDDLQEAGLALLARRLGSRRVYVLDDGDPTFGALLGDAFVRAARRVGVRVVGSGSWDPRAPQRLAPVRAAARASADTVVLAGIIDDGGIDVLRAVRRLLGPDVRLLLGDGFTPTDILAERAGRAADGAYLSVAAPSLDALTPAGRAFGRQLKAVAPGAETDVGAYLAADATRVLLAAIARSDGSRPSVRSELLATRMPHGLLGPLAFDARGDLREAPITLLRVEIGNHSSQGFPDTVLEQVVRPSAALVAP